MVIGAVAMSGPRAGLQQKYHYSRLTQLVLTPITTQSTLNQDLEREMFSAKYFQILFSLLCLSKQVCFAKIQSQTSAF